MYVAKELDLAGIGQIPLITELLKTNPFYFDSWGRYWEDLEIADQIIRRHKNSIYELCLMLFTKPLETTSLPIE